MDNVTVKPSPARWSVDYFAEDFRQYGTADYVNSALIGHIQFIANDPHWTDAEKMTHIHSVLAAEKLVRAEREAAR